MRQFLAKYRTETQALLGDSKQNKNVSSDDYLYFFFLKVFLVDQVNKICTVVLLVSLHCHFSKFAEVFNPDLVNARLRQLKKKETRRTSVFNNNVYGT